MTPRKFIRNIIKSNKRMMMTMLTSNLTLFFMYVLVSDVQSDTNPSEHIMKYIVTFIVMVIVSAFWILVIRSINKKYSEILNNQIKLESDELADFLVHHKVYKKCNIRSILEALDRQNSK